MHAIRGSSIAEHAYTYIGERIVSGVFEPGRILFVQELAKEIGVSRTPVSEALHQLEKEYLVMGNRATGRSVKVLALGDNNEMFDYREALELYAVDRAAEGRSPRGLKSLLRLMLC